MFTKKLADDASFADKSGVVSLDDDPQTVLHNGHGASPQSGQEVAPSLEKLVRVREELGKIIRGKDEVIDLVLTSMLAAGSVLLEDVPGVGKTTLAKSLATLIDLDYARVQCTPDLLPADILGSSIFQPSTGEFEFRPGPIFCDLLIADEVNRASPRTQSALLEAMAEHQVTIDGQKHQLHQPFLVIATQNPDGFEGTFPLPESQLDRFLLRLTMDYPDAESEIDMLLEPDGDAATTVGQEDFPDAIMTREDLLSLQSAVQSVTVDRKIAAYVVSIVGATRRDSRLRVGCSPRGSKMLLRAARARAILAGRSFVIPDDVQALAAPAMGHRMTMRAGSSRIEDCLAVVDDIVRQTEIPV